MGKLVSKLCPLQLDILGSRFCRLIKDLHQLDLRFPGRRAGWQLLDEIWMLDVFGEAWNNGNLETWRALSLNTCVTRF